MKNKNVCTIINEIEDTINIRDKYIWVIVDKTDEVLVYLDHKPTAEEVLDILGIYIKEPKNEH